MNRCQKCNIVIEDYCGNCQAEARKKLVKYSVPLGKGAKRM